MEICLLIEAGSSVSDERATASDLRNRMMLERYINLVQSFQMDEFVSPSVQEEMAMKLFNAKKGPGTIYGRSLRIGERILGHCTLLNYQVTCQVCQVVNS